MLRHIEKQHATLLLRQSLQQKLRHLQRSLPSDDLGVLWERLDMVLYNAARRLSGLGDSDDPAENPQRTLTHLPTRYGGLGLLSYAQCAPLAAKASNNHSLRALQPLFPSLEFDPDHPTQTALCEEAFEGTLNSLFLRLTPLERVLVIEAGSYFGRCPLDVVPSNNALRLQNHDMVTLLRTRLLVPERTPTCRTCSRPSSILHNETCTARNFATYTRRHDMIKNAISDTLNNIPGCKATIEPIVPPAAEAGEDEQGERRNDVRFTTGGRCNLPSMDIDVMVTSLARSKALDKPSNTPELRHPHTPEAARTMLNWALNRQAMAKHRRAPTAQPADFPLHTFVLSTGGAMENGSEKLLKVWKREVAVGTFAYMVNRMSLSSVRSRASTYRE